MSRSQQQTELLSVNPQDQNLQGNKAAGSTELGSLGCQSNCKQMLDASIQFEARQAGTSINYIEANFLYVYTNIVEPASDVP
jgi:hypothetical protein